MEYSKRVQEYCKIYGLTPQDVFYCMLVAEGASQGEAFLTIFRPVTSSNGKNGGQSQATQLARKKPTIKTLIKFLTELHYIAEPPVNKGKRAKNVDPGEEERGDFSGQFRTKDEILTALAETIPNLKGKEKADVLMKIADLQQMKKEERAEDEERVIYYLPLRCNKCNLYREARREASES